MTRGRSWPTEEDHRGGRRHRRPGRRPGARHPGRPERPLRGARASPATPTPTRRRRWPPLGAEVVAADLDDQASLERAFAGAYGAFCVTNFWEHFSPEKELAQAEQHGPRGQGRRACSTSSGRRSRTPASGCPLADDRMPTLHGQVQGPALRRARARPTTSSATPACPTTFLLTVVLLGQLHLLRRRARSAAPDGKLALTLPDGRQEAARASRPRTSASAPTASSSGAASSSARRWASRAST